MQSESLQSSSDCNIPVQKISELLITLLILIIGCAVTYYFHTKSKEDKFLKYTLSLYGLNFFSYL